MKKTLFKVSVGLFITLIGLTSCKKKSDPSTHDKFVGTWKLHQFVVDADGNGSIGVLDPVFNTDTMNVTIVFNANGTGTANSGSTTALTWALSNSDSYLTLTETGGPHVTHLLITTSPGSTFVVKDTSASPIQWQTFNKQ